MITRSTYILFLASLFTFTIGVFNTLVVLAQVRTSPNYQIQSDSVNVGGGLSTSTNYTQESTFGEVATGPSDSTIYSLRAGYQQLQAVYLSLAVSGDVVMDPELPGVTGGIANGSTTVTVTTDSPGGYRLSIQSKNDPAMQSDVETIANYSPGAAPSYDFVTGQSNVHFGFSPDGADIVGRFRHNGGNLCDQPGGTTATPLQCWDGVSTTPMVIAEAVGPRFPTGATTTLHFRVGIGGATVVSPGVYTATTTVTALPL